MTEKEAAPQSPTHTPTPWAKTRYVSDHVTIFRDVTSPEGTWPIHEVIADVDDDCNRGEANAAYIVKCVNAHKALLDVLKEAKNLIDNYSDSMESFDSGNLEKAIAKAEGGK